MSGKPGPHHKKSSKQHKAAVEAAVKKRELAKVLKKEGVNDIAEVFERAKKKPKLAPEEDEVAKDTTAQPAPAVRSEQEKKKKLKERKKRSLLVTKKTKKGQPIMNNIIQDLVAKLQK
jgi:hypothetical protein